MKKTKYILWGAAGLLFLLGACQNEAPELPIHPEGTVPVEFTLAVKGYSTPWTTQSRSYSDGITVTLGGPVTGATSRAGEVLNDSRIQHLHVLQFSDGISDMDSKLIFKTEVTWDKLNEEVENSLTKYGFSLYLAESSSSRIVFVANQSGNAEIRSLAIDGSYTLADFKAETPEFPEGAMRQMPMVGECVSAIPGVGTNRVDMKRLAARIDLKVSYQTPLSSSNGTLILDQLNLRNVPNLASYYLSPGFFPTADAPNFIDYAQSFGFVTESGTTTVDATWYIPENLRGEGSNGGGTQDNKWSGTAPDGLCTYLDLSGVFYEDGDYPDLDKEREIHISLYPGGDVINDFDIKRNHHYSIETAITAISTTNPDQRVWIEILP